MPPPPSHSDNSSSSVEGWLPAAEGRGHGRPHQQPHRPPPHRLPRGGQGQGAIAARPLRQGSHAPHHRGAGRPRPLHRLDTVPVQEEEEEEEEEGTGQEREARARAGPEAEAGVGAKAREIPAAVGQYVDHPPTGSLRTKKTTTMVYSQPAAAAVVVVVAMGPRQEMIAWRMLQSARTFTGQRQH